MVAQAEHVAMHLGSLLGIIKEVYRKHSLSDIRPGDMSWETTLTTAEELICPTLQ